MNRWTQRIIVTAVTCLITSSAYAQSNVTDAVRDALVFGSGGAAETEQRVARQQQIEATRRRNMIESDRELGFQIANSRLVRHFNLGDVSDAAQYFHSMDLIGAYNDDPSMTLRIFGEFSSSMFPVTDRRGRSLLVRPTLIQPVFADGEQKYEVDFDVAGGRKLPLFLEWQRPQQKKHCDSVSRRIGPDRRE